MTRKIIDHCSTAVLLLNTGTPDSPEILDVSVYLSRLLGDKHVITLPYLLRKIVVNVFIIPFRCFRSSKRYLQLWNQFGGKFPLLHYGLSLRNNLQKRFNNSNVSIYLGMGYGHPSIESQIREIIEKQYKKLILLPLFPQYASSSSGAVLAEVAKAMNHNAPIPQIQTVHSFHDNSLYIKALSEKIKAMDYESYEMILFTYHSLPLSHVRKVVGTPFDYETACRHTTKLIAETLNLNGDRYKTVFQSQLSGRWLGPHTNETIVAEAKAGIKSILIVSPSFVADCLETVIELGKEYKQLFLRHGGLRYAQVQCLNDEPLWIDCLETLIIRELA